MCWDQGIVLYGIIYVKSLSIDMALAGQCSNIQSPSCLWFSFLLYPPLCQFPWLVSDCVIVRYISGTVLICTVWVWQLVHYIMWWVCTWHENVCVCVLCVCVPRVCANTVRALCDQFCTKCCDDPLPIISLLGWLVGSHFVLNQADTNLDRQCLLIGSVLLCKITDQ